MANTQTTVPTFVAAQVLTAAQLNQSAATGVPVFATTVTRDAGFGGAGEKALAEGQLCYLESTNVVQYYDGAAWATVGPAPAASSALTFITAQTITASSAFQVNGCFSATYDNYLVKMFLSTYVNATQLRFGTSGTPNTGSIYQTMYGVFRNPTSPNTNVNGSNNQTKFSLTVENDGPVFYNIEIYNPFATASTGIVSTTASGLSSNASVSRGNYGGGVNGTTSFTDIIIIPDSGTIDGYIKIYGYQNS
jgi:hypothetical protein